MPINQQNVWEERAEFLSREELQGWTAELPHNKSVIRDLIGTGAKLLTGPRGCGKSTLLKLAYYRMLEGGNVFPVYVNYARSLELEPLLQRHASAAVLFRQWLFAKILVGAEDAVCEAGTTAHGDTLIESLREARSFVHDIESGNSSSVTLPRFTSESVQRLLLQMSSPLGKSRVVILMDDAAHAFSPEQQREFFEVFRGLRSRDVSPKAAIYPGVTSFSPNFHLGHEAKLVEAWYSPDKSDYLTSMRSLYKRRIHPSFGDAFAKSPELLDYVAFAAFGIPRTMINILSQVLIADDGNVQTPTVRRCDTAVADQANSTESIYRSLEMKLPRYKYFVKTGEELLANILSDLREYNYNRPVSGKAATIALSMPLSGEAQRVLDFMEYAGLLRKLGVFSRGNRGQYLRYVVHYSVLISHKSLNLGKQTSPSATVEALCHRDAHAVRHTRVPSLIQDLEGRCRLDLEPCSKCGTPRTTPEAKFCTNCGASLPVRSVYEDLLKSPIGALPITQHKKDGIMKHSKLRTVKDILMDEEHTLIRAVPGVGPVWARRITVAAEEHVTL